MTREETIYWQARREHVALLRAEGLSFAKIGGRLGVTRRRIQSILDYLHRKELGRVLRRKEGAA